MSLASEHAATIHHAGSKKLGPLPVWGWGAILGLGVVAYMYFRNRSSANASAAATGTVQPDLTANPLGTAGDISQVESTPNNPTGSSIVDNTSWETQAVAWLVTQGKNPLTSSQAIDKYLNGEPLSYSEGQLIASVISKFGLPPQGVSSDSSIAPKPVTPTHPVSNPPQPIKPIHHPTLPQHKPNPPKHTRTETYQSWTGHHIIVWGDTLSKLAERYHTTVAELASHNHIANPSRIYTGHMLIVPVERKKTVPA